MIGGKEQFAEHKNNYIQASILQLQNNELEIRMQHNKFFDTFITPVF